MTTGTEALRLWEEATKAIKAGELERAEQIAKQMHVPSDQRLIRERIK